MLSIYWFGRKCYDLLEGTTAACAWKSWRGHEICHSVQSLERNATPTSPVEGEWPVVARPLLSSKRRPHFKTRRRNGKNKNMVTGPSGTRNEDWLCWWEPAAIYPTDTNLRHGKLVRGLLILCLPHPTSLILTVHVFSINVWQSSNIWEGQVTYQNYIHNEMNTW
jgi:hypothetical protein